MTAERIVYPDSPFFAIAWRDCLAWALESPEVATEYERETGRKLAKLLPSSPIEQMIDAATGNQPTEAVNHFVDWFNANIWGSDPFVSGIPTFDEAPRGR